MVKGRAQTLPAGFAKSRSSHTQIDIDSCAGGATNGCVQEYLVLGWWGESFPITQTTISACLPEQNPTKSIHFLSKITLWSTEAHIWWSETATAITKVHKIMKIEVFGTSRYSQIPSLSSNSAWRLQTVLSPARTFLYKKVLAEGRVWFRSLSNEEPQENSPG